MRIIQGLILAALVVIAGLLFSISKKMDVPAPAPAPVVQAQAPVAPVETPAPAPVVKPVRKQKPSPVREPEVVRTVPEPIREMPAVAPAPAPAAPQAPPPPPLPPPVRTITVPAGTMFTVRLLDPISTEHHRTGDIFHASLDEALTADGVVVAQRGASVVGRVVQARQSGRVAGVAEMALEVDRISTVSGDVQIVSDTMTRQAESSKGKDAATVGILAGIGAAIGGIAGGKKGAGIGAAAGGAGGTGEVLATRGKPVKLDREARLSFRLRAPLTITSDADRLQPSTVDRDRPLLIRR